MIPLWKIKLATLVYDNKLARLSHCIRIVQSSAPFEKTAAALSRAEADLTQAEEQWLELELKREEIEGG